MSVPETLGRYRLVEELGAGGFGRVYRAEHLDLGLTRAIKIATNPEFIRELRKEGIALARLHHPRIVEIHDMDVESNPPYVVMEYVSGGDLRQLISKGPLPVERAAEIMHDLLEALEHAHSQSVIHRDIKPGNILLDSDGHAKVSDFGLGRLVALESASGSQAASLGSRSGGSAGTLQYMSPEQLDPSRLGQEQLDHRSDLYSAGLVFYEMLTGELPAGVRPRMPSQMLPVPVEIDRVIERCLAGARRERYPTARAVITALHAALEKPLQKPIVDLPPDPPRPPEPAASGWPRALAIVGILVLMIWGVKALRGGGERPSQPAIAAPAQTYTTSNGGGDPGMTGDQGQTQEGVSAEQQAGSAQAWDNTIPLPVQPPAQSAASISPAPSGNTAAPAPTMRPITRTRSAPPPEAREPAAPARGPSSLTLSGGGTEITVWLPDAWSGVQYLSLTSTRGLPRSYQLSFRVDGQERERLTRLPESVAVNFSGLSAGSHMLSVELTDGYNRVGGNSASFTVE
jgi:serine/threonine protein kinase